MCLESTPSLILPDAVGSGAWSEGMRTLVLTRYFSIEQYLAKIPNASASIVGGSRARVSYTTHLNETMHPEYTAFGKKSWKLMIAMAKEPFIQRPSTLSSAYLLLPCNLKYPNILLWEEPVRAVDCSQSRPSLRVPVNEGLTQSSVRMLRHHLHPPNNSVPISFSRATSNTRIYRSRKEMCEPSIAVSAHSALPL